MRGRALALVAGVALVLVVVVVVVSRAGPPSSAVAPGTGSAGSAPTPLASSVSAPSVATVLLPMGHLDDPANTFWELFLRPTGSARWLLRTPPGVADNGGLAVAATPTGPLAVGFLPSADLTFSPLARTSDDGVRWSTGALPGALVAAPDALAGGSPGHLVALESAAPSASSSASGSGSSASTGGQSVVSSSGDLSSWATVVGGRAVASVVPACHLVGLTAVAVEDADRLLVGGQCQGGDRIGIIAGTRSGASAPFHWSSVGPLLAGGRGPSAVLRLEVGARGVVALTRVGTGAGTSLVASWDQGATPAWTRSSPLSVGPGWRVLASGIGPVSDPGAGPAAAVTVLLGSGSRRRIERVAGSGRPWTRLPQAPSGTAAVATVGGQTDAFVASGTTLTVWTLAPGADRWVGTTPITVPLQFDSSS